MYQTLYEYLITYKQLHLPGIGSILLERKPAEADFVNKQILPPAYSLSLHSPATAPATDFFKWLASKLQIAETKAVVQFNDFSFDLKKEIAAGSKIDWEGVGVLTQGLGGEIRFEAALKDTVYESPVKAEKVIREKASHAVLVGEEEKTSEEMIELLHEKEAAKNWWWLYALIIGVLAITIIALHFSKTNDTGNTQKLPIEKSTNTYRMVK